MGQHVYRGNLAETPLPEMLYTINYYRVPGVLTARDGDRCKRVYIKDGQVIFADSTDRDERLGEYLLHNMRITQEQYDRSVEILKETGKRQGAILVEIGALTPQQLFSEVKNQIAEIVWTLFNWNSGEATFEVGRFKEEEIIQIQLDTHQVILHGVKKMPDAKRLVRLIGHKDTVLEPSENALALIQKLPLAPEDIKTFRMVDGKRTLVELCSSAPGSQTDAVKILYALMVLKVIRAKSGTIKVVAKSRQIEA